MLPFIRYVPDEREHAVFSGHNLNIDMMGFMEKVEERLKVKWLNIKVEMPSEHDSP